MNTSSHSRCTARRLLLAGAIVLLAVVLGGCLDIVQYISGSGSDIDVYLRLTLQKSVFELAGSMSDSPQDLDTMFEEEFNLNEEEVLEELPPGVSADFTTVNTDSEFGFELSYSVNRDALGELEESGAPFVPRVSLWGITIPLGEGSGSGESDEFSDAFLGSSKYRLMISKMLVSRVSEARVVSGKKSSPVSITELPDIWLLEFPMSVWFSSEEDARIEVLF